MKPIYKPRGAAAEYGDYAVNIYTGCPYRCYYCFAPQVLKAALPIYSYGRTWLAYRRKPEEVQNGA